MTWAGFIAWLKSLFTAKAPSEPKAPELELPSSGTAAIPYAAEWYEDHYKKAKFTNQNTAAWVVNRLLRLESIYKMGEEATGVHWYMIGALDSMECDNHPLGVLHNGELIVGTGKKTKLVPAGRGPFASKLDSIVDALKYDGLLGKKMSLGEMLKWAEKYNGMGYKSRGVMSPYVWAGTDRYTKGRFVRDRVFDANAVSKRAGVAAIFKELERRGHKLQ